MRIKLRPLKNSDIWILNNWINDPEIIQFTNIYKPVSEPEQIAWFNDLKKFKENSIFGIELIKDNKLIGTCGLYDYDWVSRKAELRIKIAEKTYRGMGYGKEALGLLLDYGFFDQNLLRIWLKVLTTNPPAINLYKKSGFKEEGLLRSEIYIKGQLRDTLVFGILKEEYAKGT